MAATPPESFLDLLDRPLFASFATVRPDGAPQVNPMWFIWDGEQGVVKLTHTKVRSNYRALQREKRVGLSIIDPDDGYRYLSLRGTVTNIQDDPEGEFYKVLQRRYRGRADAEIADRAVRVVLTITPDHFRVHEN
ncbi:MAG: PPOX class F420-dependent oxidoreductase [Candidatus Dormibacteraeota bacterium]|nr:PPOX class F420-dependent oxidoreductase [Candidatus Dormibacteraeota bacterium]